MNKPIIALMYDFDKTLSTMDMQNYSFIPKLGLTPKEFWEATGEFSSKNGVEKTLAYMYMMIQKAKEKGVKITREFLNECGRKIEYFPGVETWFKRINEYAEKQGIIVEHYLVSSGTKEIVEGCSIFKEFTEAYGCEFLFDESKEACWPKFAINYTQKTQFYFRVSKGATDINDDSKVNEKQTGRRIPYRNIVYLGDGMTDIACMTLVKHNGGNSIAVYQNTDDYPTSKQLYDDGRVSFVCKSDYNEGSELEKVIHLIINEIRIENEIQEKQAALVNK